MHDHRIKPALLKSLNKLSKKDKLAYEAVLKKIAEIISSDNPGHYKNLRHDMSNLKRVQIGSSVLIFEYEQTTDIISFIDYEHHDKIYKR